VKVFILTQEENLYLPKAFAHVCEELKADVVAIVSLPAMSTHGGAIKGFLKHFWLFGIKGTFIMGWRTIIAKLKAKILKPQVSGPFYSIKQVANAFNIPFHAVQKLKSSQFDSILDDYQPDLLVSISCPQIIREKIRNRFINGCINVHGAPLPKYRGLMPAFWMLKNNETEGAATVHVLDEKLDDGDIILQQKVSILPEDTWDSMVKKTKLAGAEALVEAVKQIKNGTAQYRPNLEIDATYFSFPTAQDKKDFFKADRRFF
jgi:methionyl-tRNA formyltransferase